MNILWVYALFLTHKPADKHMDTGAAKCWDQVQIKYRGNKQRWSEKINLNPTLPKEHKSSFVVPVSLTQKWPKQYFPSYIQVSFESRISVHLMLSVNL